MVFAGSFPLRVSLSEKYMDVRGILMSKRGQKGFEERVGVERFKQLVAQMTIPQISALFCDHFTTEDERARCEACQRAIYRAKQRVEQAHRQDKSFAPLDEFEIIPEIQSFIKHQQAKQVKFKGYVNILRRMWTMIRESGNQKLVETQRPAIWGVEHMKFILVKMDELHISKYTWKQALRRFFESMGQSEILKNPLLTASRKDMRSPNGAKRTKDRFTPQEFIKILEGLSEDEAFYIKLHVTVKSREGDHESGSLLGLKYKNVNWSDTFYGMPMVTIDVYEPKTKGGTFWRHCPIDLWFKDLSKELEARWIKTKNQDDYIVSIDYEGYRTVWTRISEKMGLKFEAHDCRRSPSGWLRDLGLSELALGQYNPTTGEAIGYTGVGWENSEIYYQRYGKMNPLAIYDKTKRLDMSMFNGLIQTILANK